MAYIVCTTASGFLTVFIINSLWKQSYWKIYYPANSAWQQTALQRCSGFNMVTRLHPSSSPLKQQGRRKKSLLLLFCCESRPAVHLQTMHLHLIIFSRQKQFTERRPETNTWCVCVFCWWGSQSELGLAAIPGRVFPCQQAPSGWQKCILTGSGGDVALSSTHTHPHTHTLTHTHTHLEKRTNIKIFQRSSTVF